MTLTRVVRAKNGKGKIRDVALFAEFVRRVQSEPGEVVSQSSGPCEEACAQHQGVDDCGATWVLCNDGEAYLIDP